MLFDIKGAITDELHDELFIQKQVTVSVLRLDKIHPQVSGNKIFKLHFFLEEAMLTEHKTILTFGGPYSNHLSATAYACKILNLKSIGLVRGERPATASHTILQCGHDGMQLKFISRKAYDEKDKPVFLQDMEKEFGPHVLVPEGGYHPKGARGAALISSLMDDKDYTHICMATGTATTLAGICMSASPQQYVVAIPVLKGITDIPERVKYLTGMHDTGNLKILDDYHFGGYAKKTNELTGFMNDCWTNYQLPLDFVYTAKMLYAVTDSIKKDRFKKGSKILCLHTGGLQGNKSLPLNSLLY